MEKTRAGRGLAPAESFFVSSHLMKYIYYSEV